MTSVTNVQLMNTLGDLRESLGSLKQEVEHGTRSRKVLHQKIEDQSAALNEAVRGLINLNNVIERNTQATAQARDIAQAALENFHRFEVEFKTVTLPALQAATDFKTEASPVISQMKIVRNIIVVLFGTGVLSFAGLLAAFVWAREHLGILLRMVLDVS
jgi:methyl-accepting chemotaxis protein